MVVMLRAFRKHITDNIVGLSLDNFFIGVLPDEDGVASIYVTDNNVKKVVNRSLVRVLFKFSSHIACLSYASKVKELLEDSTINNVVVTDEKDTSVKCDPLYIISIAGPRFIGEFDDKSVYSLDIEVSLIT